VLEVPKTSSETEIRSAWKKKSLLYHPDRMVGKTRAEKLLADKLLKDINEAKDILLDSSKKSI